MSHLSAPAPHLNIKIPVFWQWLILLPAANNLKKGDSQLET
ncbi:hypothetical protein [Microcoleus sp. FACHB-672]|nr:hypothetical protein [Microcoleus sp. FACHB-672]